MIPLNYQFPVDHSRKRPYESDSDSNGVFSKRFVNKSFLRLLINTKSMGCIIGKAGAGIDDIRRNSGIDISVDNKIEPYRNVPERFVTCSGSIDGLIEALSILLKRLPSQFDHVPEGCCCKHLVIDASEAGKLLGRGGETIRTINEETSTTIRISNDLESPFDKKNRVILITGKEEDVVFATTKIKALVDAYDLADYPNAVSIRIAVPVQSIPLLFPKDAPHPSLVPFDKLLIQPAPIEDTITGYSTRGVDISGATKDVVKAKSIIEGLVKEWIEEGTITSTAITLKIVVNNQVAGVVIGKNATNLHRFQEEFKVHAFRVAASCYTGPDLEKVFYFVGTAENILLAVNSLLNQLAVNSLERRLPVDLIVYQQAAIHQSISTSSKLALNLPPPIPMPTGLPPGVPHPYEMENPGEFHSKRLNPNAPYYEPKPYYVPAYPTIVYSVQPQPPTVNYDYIDGSLEEGRVIIAVPTDLCGRIIGRHGVVINYIMESSHCKISIQQRDSLNKSVMRKIVISGPSDGIECCVRMIHLFMNIPYNDVELLTLTPYSMNADLTWFLTPYPPFSVHMRYSGNMEIPIVTNAVEVKEPAQTVKNR